MQGSPSKIFLVPGLWGLEEGFVHLDAWETAGFARVNDRAWALRRLKYFLNFCLKRLATVLWNVNEISTVHSLFLYLLLTSQANINKNLGVKTRKKTDLSLSKPRVQGCNCLCNESHSVQKMSLVLCNFPEVFMESQHYFPPEIVAIHCNCTLCTSLYPVWMVAPCRYDTEA